MMGLSPAEQAFLVLLKRHGLDNPEGVMAYRGGADLDKPGLGDRRRTRMELADESGERRVLFLKRYERPPAILAGAWRWLRHGCALSAAEMEARNIHAARRAGVATMQVVSWQSGAWGSYLITTAVPGDALERQSEDFWRRFTRDDEAGGRLVAGLADLVRSLHAAGYVHRDLYASHVFLEERGGQVGLYLIDLARMFRPRWRRFRWRVKDLASLHYSLPRGWIGKWWDAMLSRYLGQCSAGTVNRWRKAIERKSDRIARRAAEARADGAAEKKPE